MERSFLLKMKLVNGIWLHSLTCLTKILLEEIKNVFNPACIINQAYNSMKLFTIGNKELQLKIINVEAIG